MDRINSIFQAKAYDTVDVEIRSDRLTGFADLIRFVCFESMQCESILVRIDRDRPDFDFVGTSENAGSYLASIGSEYLLENRHRLWLVAGRWGGWRGNKITRRCNNQRFR